LVVLLLLGQFWIFRPLVDTDADVGVELCPMVDY
jgi:hypothetical protein